VIGWFIKYRSVEMKRVVNPVLDVNTHPADVAMENVEGGG